MLENYFDNNYIALYVEGVINKLPNSYSKELLLTLYRIHDNLLMYKE